MSMMNDEIHSANHCQHSTMLKVVVITFQSLFPMIEVSSLNRITQISTFKLDYGSLYERLCATAREEPPMLLLYLLLHRNSGYRNYVLSRINLEVLVCCSFRYNNIFCRCCQYSKYCIMDNEKRTVLVTVIVQQQLILIMYIWH